MPPDAYAPPGYLYDAQAVAQAAAKAAAQTASNVAGAGVTPLSTTAWSVTAWFIDSVNGNDQTNNGQTNTSPFQTWAHLLAVWGTDSPILNVDVLVTFINAPPSPALDPIFATPSGTGSLTVQGSLLEVASFTLANVSPRNRGFGTAQLLQFNGWSVGSIPPQSYLVLANATKGSTAIIYQFNSGTNTILCSQPLTSVITPPPGFPTQVEDNTWANGDVIIAYLLPRFAVERASFTPSSSASRGLSFFHMNLVASSAQPVQYGDFVRNYECVCDGSIEISPNLSSGLFFGNCGVNQVGGGSPTGSGVVGVLGGFFNQMNLASVQLGNDLILGNSFHSLTSNSTVNDLCIMATGGHGLSVENAGFIENRNLNHAAPVVWGTGGIQLTFATWVFRSPAVNALTVAVLTIGNTSTAFAVSVSGGVASLLGSGTAGRALNAVNLDTAVGSGGFLDGSGNEVAIGIHFNGIFSNGPL